MKNRTKHIDVKYHYVREQVKNGNLIFEYCNTENQEADLLTKALTAPRTVMLKGRMNVEDIAMSPEDVAMRLEVIAMGREDNAMRLRDIAVTREDIAMGLQDNTMSQEERIDYMFVLRTDKEESKDTSLEYLRSYRLKRDKIRSKNFIEHKSNDNRDIEVNITNDAIVRKHRLSIVSSVAGKSLGYFCHGLGSSPRLMYSTICWTLSRLKNTLSLIRSVTRQMIHIRDNPKLGWVNDFNFNVLSGSILTDPIESQEPLDEEMMRIFHDLCNEYGNGYVLGTTSFWKNFMTPSVEISNIDRILVHDSEELCKYLTTNGHPTNLLIRKIVLNHMNVRRKGLYYNRWGFRVPFNIQHIDHGKFLLECQSCHKDYLYCFCKIKERLCRKPIVSMRPPREIVAHIMTDDHNKRPMRSGKQEEQVNRPTQSSGLSALMRYESELEALMIDSEDELHVSDVAPMGEHSNRSHIEDVDEEKGNQTLSEDFIETLRPTLHNSSPFIVKGIRGTYNDRNMSVIVIHHETQELQKKLMLMQQELEVVMSERDRA